MTERSIFAACKVQLKWTIVFVMMSVDDIIRTAGGATLISRESEATRKPIKRGAVHRWRNEGIDEAHWPLLMRLLPGLTVQQIFDANREVERTKNPKRRAEARAYA
jgi:hypothetical protein